MKGENFDRVIAGLERCAASDFCGVECPYAYAEGTEPGKLCIQDLCHDALEVIRAQEKQLKLYKKATGEICKLHSCLDCRKKETCGSRPTFMSSVRLNCPQWEGGAAGE